jgi:hypothetical protein
VILNHFLPFHHVNRLNCLKKALAVHSYDWYLLDHLPHILFIIHIPSLKIHSILIQRTSIVQVCWRTTHGSQSSTTNDTSDDSDAFFWELALTCQASNHLYLWCPNGCACVVFPNLTAPINSSGDTTAQNLSNFRTSKSFVPHHLQWIKQPSFHESGFTSTATNISKTASQCRETTILMSRALIAADMERLIICHLNQLK